MPKRPLWMWLDEAADLLAGGANHHLAERILDAADLAAKIAKQETQLRRLIAETQGFMVALAGAEAHATLRFDAFLDHLADIREQLIQLHTIAKELDNGC